METYEYSQGFAIGSLRISPVHMRIERLPLVIASHRHSNVSYEIHYTAHGHGNVLVEGVTYPVEPGTLYVTGPGVLHAQRSDPADPVLEYCLYLHCQREEHHLPDPLDLFAATAFWMGRDTGEIAQLLTQLVKEGRQPQPDWWQMSETVLRQIVILLTRMYRRGAATPARSAPAPTVTRAGLMPILEDAFFYRHPSLTLDDLARLLNLSARQTQRLLLANFGKTFSQKLTEARMAAASQLLVTTDLSVTDISDRVGFSSIEHFSSAFRRFTGVSPRRYRQSHRLTPMASAGSRADAEE